MISQGGGESCDIKITLDFLLHILEMDHGSPWSYVTKWLTSFYLLCDRRQNIWWQNIVQNFHPQLTPIIWLQCVSGGVTIYCSQLGEYKILRKNILPIMDIDVTKQNTIFRHPNIFRLLQTINRTERRLQPTWFSSKFSRDLKSNYLKPRTFSANGKIMQLLTLNSCMSNNFLLSCKVP